MADTPDLGSGAARREGSSPFLGTTLKTRDLRFLPESLFLCRKIRASNHTTQKSFSAMTALTPSRSWNSSNTDRRSFASSVAEVFIGNQSAAICRSASCIHSGA